MVSKKDPWWKDKSKIKCCKDCVPPKRYPGCGSSCEQYKQEKAKDQELKQKARIEKEKMGRAIGRHDFDMTNFKCRRRDRY